MVIMTELPAPADQIQELRFTVDFDYPAIFTRGVFRASNPALADCLRRREPSRVPGFVAVIDAGVAAAWPNLATAIPLYAQSRNLRLAAPALVLPGGEAAKNGDGVVDAVLGLMREAGIDRHSFLVAIGGGAFLDAAGFAAATCHRGVRLLRLPTTVLAQNDAAVGVKNGINRFGSKNFIGSFAPPWGVIADFDFLDTLEPRDRRAGLAEAVKVAAIRDSGFLEWLEEEAGALAAFAPDASEVMIRRSAALHMRHIAEGGDPFETGSARPLDFGHWAAHKLESMTGHALRHGEAVAIGIALDGLYSAETGLLEGAAAERLCALLERLGFRLFHPAMEARDGAGRRLVLDGLREFQEHLGGELTLTMLAAPGRGCEIHAVDEAALDRCIGLLAERDRRP